MNRMNNRDTARDIFLAGVERVRPDNLVKKVLAIEGKKLRIDDLLISLEEVNNIFLTGAGKACAAMAESVESVLGNRITSGHIVTKYGYSAELKYTQLTGAGHPVPDENGLAGTKRIMEMAGKAGENDLLLCLLSGGGSALLADVPEGCTLEDLKLLNSVLLKCGADINEINCIRKHLSGVKGGGLSARAYPARVISLILSDVIGDPLDVIASGPTSPDPTTFDDALKIIEKYHISGEISPVVIQILKAGADKRRPETLKKTDNAFVRTENRIIGNNKLALEAALSESLKKGYKTEIITDRLSGDISDVKDRIIAVTADRIRKFPGKKSCLLFGGEPTIKVTGNGIGGRNQHLALLAAQSLREMPGVTLLSGGTDGTDGPTDAAGAIADSSTLSNALKLGLGIQKYIKDCDSYNFFRKAGGLLITGPTLTNVMDLIVVLID